MDDPQSSDLRLDFARLEGKVDVVITRHDLRIEQLEQARADHEERLRVLEQVEVVTPKGLWLVGSGIVTLGVGITILINWLDQVIN